MIKKDFGSKAKMLIDTEKEIFLYDNCMIHDVSESQLAEAKKDKPNPWSSGDSATKVRVRRVLLVVNSSKSLDDKYLTKVQDNLTVLLMGNFLVVHAKVTGEIKVLLLQKANEVYRESDNTKSQNQVVPRKQGKD